MEQIKLELTVDETNTILASLGQQAYIKVVDLVQKIQQQGTAQLGKNTLESQKGNQKELKNTGKK